MKRVLAILLLVPFIMVLAPPCHAAENGEVAVSLLTLGFSAFCQPPSLTLL